MPCWAFKANITNLSRRTTQAISFHDMAAEWARNEMKSVTHVHAHCVTNVPAPCREGLSIVVYPTVSSVIQFHAALSDIVFVENPRAENDFPGDFFAGQNLEG